MVILLSCYSHWQTRLLVYCVSYMECNALSHFGTKILATNIFPVQTPIFTLRYKILATNIFSTNSYSPFSTSGSLLGGHFSIWKPEKPLNRFTTRNCYNLPGTHNSHPNTWRGRPCHKGFHTFLDQGGCALTKHIKALIKVSIRWTTRNCYNLSSAHNSHRVGMGCWQGSNDCSGFPPCPLVP